MILSGQQIESRIDDDIIIDPYNPNQLNSNSVNLTLHDELMTYEEVVLDMRKANRVRRIPIPQDGYVLKPNQLYLARTVERTETHNLGPMLEGRSSVARLGLFINATGGFGDVGFCGYWTLQMFAVQPLRIYPGIPICQIFYHEIIGDFLEYSSDKYQHNRDVQPSLFFKELNPEVEDDAQMELQFGLERSHS